MHASGPGREGALGENRNQPRAALVLLCHIYRPQTVVSLYGRHPLSPSQYFPRGHSNPVHALSSFRYLGSMLLSPTS